MDYENYALCGFVSWLNYIKRFLTRAISDNNK
jgi:hypothetical protein